MTDMNQMIEKLGKQFSMLQEKMEQQKENSGKRAEDVISSAKNEVARMNNEIQVAAEKEKGRISGRLLKAQMKFQAKKDELKTKVSDVKNKSVKERAQIETEAAVEYAAVTIDYALLAIEDAILAFYEAVEKVENFEKEYGETKEQIIDSE